MADDLWAIPVPVVSGLKVSVSRLKELFTYDPKNILEEYVLPQKGEKLMQPLKQLSKRILSTWTTFLGGVMVESCTIDSAKAWLSTSSDKLLLMLEYDCLNQDVLAMCATAVDETERSRQACNS